jgi:D-cysteine desulfhydrase family pyridoxal phosphate-dependent enzyme
MRCVERISLAHLPTPVESAPRLSEVLGIRVLVKRDDQTGLALGGNKARKLEYLVADAKARGCDTLVTAGGPQSNFARMTAAAAAQLGMACHLVLGGRSPSVFSGNLILDRLFGAELHFAGTDDWRVWETRVVETARELGPRAYAMPIGGASAVGSFAFARAAEELLEQLPEPPDWVVVADGSGGTHAGLLVGLPKAVRILGVDVARPPRPHAERVPELAQEIARLAGRPLPAFELELSDQTGPRYGAITRECREAVQLAARTEGVVLDPVYTGKAMAGLIAEAKAGRVRGTVVFWHTGGAPALFADDFRSF